MKNIKVLALALAAVMLLATLSGAAFALDAEEEPTKGNEAEAWNGIVTVALDMDGDGRVPVLVPVSGKDYVSSADEVEKIPASAAAWVSRKDGRRTKTCKSW